MSNLSCIFEAHLPELHAIIKKSNAAADQDDNQANQANKVVKMKPIQQISTSTTASKVLSLFKNVEDLPDRLTQFSVFCLNNKKAINKLL